MSRRRAHPEHENHERWLISYADFITLMFAFFVVMFASSQSDKEKLREVSETFSGALKEGRGHSKTKDGRSKGLTNLRPEDLKLVALAPSLEKLTTSLRDEIKNGSIQVSMEARGLVISMKEAAVFPPGGDAIAPEGYRIVEKVAAIISKVPNPIRLEGHTDSIPIRSGRFKSNWELSAARSIAMLHALSERYNVDLHRMAVVGYGETVAVDTNETEEGRKRNRRVDIAILNESSVWKEAKPVH